MSLLEELRDKEVWLSYYQRKEESGNLSKKELEELKAFIDAELYKGMAEKLARGEYIFSPPEKIKINKMKTGKKRVVYKYATEEAYMLKVIGYLLYRYDDKISPACYSFRKNHTVKMALHRLHHMRGLRKKYCVKVDVSNYFNSIPERQLIEVLRTIITDDDKLLNLLERLLSDDQAYEEGRLIHEHMGAMAGMPLSPFFANVYLLSMDEYFVEKKIPYMRYSDDILFFVNSEEEARHYAQVMFEQLKQKGLQVNKDKFCIMAPGEPWEFLGVKYENGIFDLSDATKLKIKGKIKRKAKALYRWRKKKGVSYASTAHVLLRIFNKKFYDEREEGDFSWSRYFFSLLNTSKSLEEIDHYFVQYIRYLHSGRHYKGNYRVSYEEIKKLGYRSLVNEYYRFKNFEKE